MWIDRFLLMCILLPGIMWIVVLNLYYRGGVKRLDPKRNVVILSWLGVALPVLALIAYAIRRF